MQRSRHNNKKEESSENNTEDPEIRQTKATKEAKNIAYIIKRILEKEGVKGLCIIISCVCDSIL